MLVKTNSTEHIERARRAHLIAKLRHRPLKASDPFNVNRNSLTVPAGPVQIIHKELNPVRFPSLPQKQQERFE